MWLSCGKTLDHDIRGHSFTWGSSQAFFAICCYKRGFSFGTHNHLQQVLSISEDGVGIWRFSGGKFVDHEGCFADLRWKCC